MPRGLALKTQRLITEAVAILHNIQPATVRGICYQLFNRKLIPNMGKNSTDRVSRALVRAREEGIIPWTWIVDDHRPVETPSTWDDPDAYIDAVLWSYRRDRWAMQPERVMVVSEKGTIGGVLRPIMNLYGVPFAVYHGFGSATAIYDLAGRSVADRRPLTILYAGDFDPSGLYMSAVDLPERLARYGGEARIVRIAVTPEQITDRQLLTFTAEEKRKDARYGWFVEHHGRTCCEVDALDPNDLRHAVEAAIRARIDGAAWDRAELMEDVELASLRAFLQTWPGAA